MLANFGDNVLHRVSQLGVEQSFDKRTSYLTLTAICGTVPKQYVFSFSPDPQEGENVFNAFPRCPKCVRGEW